MAAYPTIDTSSESTRTPIDGLQYDQADNGTPRARTLYTVSAYDFDIVHRGLSSTDRDSVLSHYAAEASNTFSYTWPDGSIAHTAHYRATPLVQWRPGTTYDVTVRLRGWVT